MKLRLVPYERAIAALEEKQRLGLWDALGGRVRWVRSRFHIDGYQGLLKGFIPFFKGWWVRYHFF